MGAVAIHLHLDLVFIVDPANCRMQSFRGDGTPMNRWDSECPDDGQFQCVDDGAFLARSQDRGHRIFVADTNNARIQVFSVDGSFIRKWGSYGEGDGQFRCPQDIAVLARSQDRILARSQDRGHPTQDLVYVTDSFNHRIQVFGIDGTFIRKWGTRGSGHGQFNEPCGVAVHPTRNLIFIAEFWGHRIQAFLSDGTFLFKWGSEGSADGQFCSPAHLALHPTRDLLFVADIYNHRVQVFDLDGSFVCKWGSEGQADGEFTEPSGVSVHPSQDMVYVSDEHRVQVFSLFHTSRKRKRIADS